MAPSGRDAGRIGADFGARLARRLGVPDWLVYHAFYADIGARQPYLRIAAGLFDLRPKLALAKHRLQRRLQAGELPPIGHLHIPKTAGTYTQSLQGLLPHINFAHVVSRTDRSDRLTPVGLTPIRPDKLAEYFLFTNVRNPLTHLVSYYHHTKGYPGFVNPNHYDYDLAQSGFEALVRAVIGREDRWPSRRFLFPQLFDQSGRCIVKWINRTDRLDADIGKFAGYFDLTFDPQERRRVSPMHRIRRAIPMPSFRFTVPTCGASVESLPFIPGWPPKPAPPPPIRSTRSSAGACAAASLSSALPREIRQSPGTVLRQFCCMKCVATRPRR